MFLSARNSAGTEVVNALVQSANVQYAVIRVSSTNAFPERLVIAYPNEEALRGLIAGPSILGLGFASQEEAWLRSMMTSRRQMCRGKRIKERSQLATRNFKPTL